MAKSIRAITRAGAWTGPNLDRSMDRATTGSTGIVEPAHGVVLVAAALLLMLVVLAVAKMRRRR